MASRYMQGKYVPINPKKYIGCIENIVYRSSWERACLSFFDNQEAIIAYSSEETVVPYLSPVDGKFHRYFVDFFLHVRQVDGSIKKILVEVKPHEQTLKPVKRPKEEAHAFADRVATYLINQAKWGAATAYARQIGASFLVMTEKHIFPNHSSLPRYKQPKKKG